MKQTFNIPEGCKTVSIEQIGNTIVTTFEPKFKKGDFVAIDESNDDFYSLGIIYDDNNFLFLYNKRFNNTKWHEPRGISKIARLATESETQLLLDKMYEAGYDWDAEKCEVVTYKWRPEDGECYFVPAALSQELYYSYTFDDDPVDRMYLERGLICKTGEEAVNMAKKMLEAIK